MILKTHKNALTGCLPFPAAHPHSTRASWVSSHINALPSWRNPYPLTQPLRTKGRLSIFGAKYLLRSYWETLQF